MAKKRQYDNPYISGTQQYNTYRYFCKKYPEKSYEEIKNIVDNWSYKHKCHYSKYPKCNNNTSGKPTYKELEYPTYDQDGIIEIDERYVYYVDKVWSKGQDRYLKPMNSSKGQYLLLYNKDTNDNRKYRKYYINKVICD